MRVQPPLISSLDPMDEVSFGSSFIPAKLLRIWAKPSRANQTLTASFIWLLMLLRSCGVLGLHQACPVLMFMYAGGGHQWPRRTRHCLALQSCSVP